MTATFTNTLRKAILALTIATTLGAMTSTQTFAYSAEAQQQCTGDAFRLCSSEIPNIPKITACMFKHRADLSLVHRRAGFTHGCGRRHRHRRVIADDLLDPAIGHCPGSLLQSQHGSVPVPVH